MKKEIERKMVEKNVFYLDVNTDYCSDGKPISIYNIEEILVKAKETGSTHVKFQEKIRSNGVLRSLNAIFIKYEPESDEFYNLRVDAVNAVIKQHNDRERDTYEKLKLKYENK